MGVSLLLAAAMLLLATLLLGTGSVAWAELRRPPASGALDPGRYDALLDVPQALDADRARFGVGPRLEVPTAVLRIPRLQIEAAVNPGTSPEVLFRGAGLLAGSALPGTAGHVGLALHRDRQFRRLGELALGDAIALDTASDTLHYRVTRLTLDPAANAGLLAGESGAVLTLFTSRPFASSRRAAPRYIVRAELVAPRRVAPESP